MTHVRIADKAGDFAENKDLAREMREQQLEPALVTGEPVTLDFDGVELATQSFIHALISDLVRSDNFDALDLLTFKNCNENVRTIVSIVCDYSQEDVAAEP
jgi:hypothetical protein